MSRRPTLPPWPPDRPLRAWQRDAAAAVAAHAGPSFLASATPAAGKTTFGLHVAHRMLAEGRVRRVAVLAPTTHICRQWALDAARYGIDLEPNRPNAAGPEPPDRHGVAVTYATVAAGPGGHRRRCAEVPTLLLADEPHHLGELAAWGRSTVAAFATARFRLLLSGTPFRSDDTPIPWVAYDEDGVSTADHAYGYTEALLDGVCRPVTFHTYDGDMEWMSDGRRRRADFRVVLPGPESARRLRTALDPAGDWIVDVLRDAHARLEDLRAAGHPEAGGLVVAIDKEHAEQLAGRLAGVTGERPEIVTSDAPDASARIARFAAGTGRWLVSVLMVSEGVDVPRLRVGVYATTARTELFFRQVVGRFIRRTPVPRDQMSHVFLPSDPRLRALAAAIEEERNHALSLGPAEARDTVERSPAEAAAAWRALSSSARRDADVLRTTEPGEALQLFGDPEPSEPALAAARGHARSALPGGAARPDARPGTRDPFARGAGIDVRDPFARGAVADMGEPLARGAGPGVQDDVARGAVAGTPAPDPTPSAAAATPTRAESRTERRERLRAERRELVASLSRTTGEAHRAVHARINRATGAASVTAATADQLEKGNRLLEKDIARRR